MKKDTLHTSQLAKFQSLHTAEMLKIKGGDDKRPDRPPGTTPPPGGGSQPNGNFASF